MNNNRQIKHTPIKRDILSELLLLTQEYPVVTILGPRQAGKTTLAREFLKNYQYSNLEMPEERQFASDDPKAYLAQFHGKVIIDEIQRVPLLLSYIQVIVDQQKPQISGQFVLTGSHQLELHQAVAQSLAGRTAILNLLPFSIAELSKQDINFEKFEDYCYQGFLPRIYDQSLRPTIAYSNYYQTYVERDIRQLINLQNLSLFEKFFKLLAGRVGQIINYNSLANDIGVSIKTVKNWISILEASYIIFKLPPYYNNFGKRAIKSPKYYFTDVGLLSYILGIRKIEQVTRDPLVGQIFENLVIIECLKARYNRGQVADLFFFRDSHGNEVDLIFEQGRKLVAIEIKSSSTYSSSQLKGLNKFASLTDQIEKSYLIYNGKAHKLSNNIELINFKNSDDIFCC